MRICALAYAKRLILQSTATLATESRTRPLLRAGEWRSAAFLSYLDSNQLEDDAVQEVHDDDNMSEQQLEDQLAEFLDSSEDES